jgi:hypothetical protein
MVLKSNVNEESNQRKLSKTCHNRTHIFFFTHTYSFKMRLASNRTEFSKVQQEDLRGGNLKQERERAQKGHAIPFPSVKIYCAIILCSICMYVCIVWNDWIGWFCNWELPESSPNQASVIQENPQLTYMGPPPVVECLQVVDVKAASSFFTWGWPKVNQIVATCHSNHKIAKLFFKSKEPL